MADDRTPSRGTSVRARLMLTVVALAVVLVVAASAVTFLLLRAQLTAGLDDVAGARFDDLAAAVAAGDESLVAQDPSAQLLTADGEVVAASPALGSAPLLAASQVAAAASRPVTATVSRPSRTALRSAGTRAEAGSGARAAEGAARWRVRAGPVRLGRGEAVLAVAADESAVEAGLDRVTPLLLGVGAGLLLATSLLGVLGVRRALRPVGLMVERASRASAAGDLPVPPGRDELARLALTLNAVLGRVHVAVTRERAFIDDASHELRTPLAVLAGEVELARTCTTDEELQECLAAAAHAVTRMTELTDDLLLVAREGAVADDLDGSPAAPAASSAGAGGTRDPSSPHRPVTDLRALVPEELRLLAPLVPRTSLSVDDPGRTVGGGGEALVPGPDGAWARVLANLVRNAGAAGAGEVVVRLGVGAEQVSLVVDDDGPGFAPGLAGPDQAGLDRLRRGDSSRAGGGTGLGLAIVDALVRARRGHVVLGARPRGGGRVSVTVPVARPAAPEPEDG